MRDEPGECLQVRTAVGLNQEYFLKARTTSRESLSERAAESGVAYRECSTTTTFSFRAASPSSGCLSPR